MPLPAPGKASPNSATDIAVVFKETEVTGNTGRREGVGCAGLTPGNLRCFLLSTKTSLGDVILPRWVVGLSPASRGGGT